MLGAPVRRRKETASVASFPAARPNIAWPRVNRAFRHCDAALLTGVDHVLDAAERLVHRTVAIVLMGISMYAVITSIVTLTTTTATASAAMTSAVDSLLFAVILVEITATMRREERHSKLKWYLVIGIISAVREILTIGARLSLHSIPASDVSSVVVEMGVAIVVVIGLAIGLRLADRTDGRDEDAPSQTSPPADDLRGTE